MSQFTEDQLIDRVCYGALKLSKLVARTYGPNGKNILLERRSGMIFSRDGFSVACEIEFENHLESCGAELVKELSGKINKKVGDGTTTAIVLLAALIEEGHRLIRGGVSPTEFVRGVQSGLREAEEILSAISIPLKTRKEIGSLCSLAVKGEISLAEVVTEAIFSVPVGGTVVVEDAPGVSSYVEFKPGLSLEGGFVPYLQPPTFSGEKTFEIPQVAIFKKGLSSYSDISAVAEEASQWPHPLVIVAPFVEGDALLTMKMNPELNGQPWTAIRLPTHWKFGEKWAENLVALTGATLVDEELGTSPQSFKPEWLGFCQKIQISEKKSIFTGDTHSSERVLNRIKDIEGEISRNDSLHDQRAMRKQISMLSGGLCLLKLGGVTEYEMKEKRARVEDALCAVRAGIEGGIIPGTGSAFLTVRDFLLSRDMGEGDFSYGRRALCTALEAPTLEILRNSGLGRDYLIRLDEERERDYNPWLGWDVISNKLVDCKEAGIWDTKLSALEILKGAISVASVLFNSGAVVWKTQRK